MKYKKQRIEIGIKALYKVEIASGKLQGSFQVRKDRIKERQMLGGLSGEYNGSLRKYGEIGEFLLFALM